MTMIYGEVQSSKPPTWLLLCQLARMDKPIGSLLLLWPTLSALWIATGGVPPWLDVLVFCLGTFLMRSAGCVINDIFDRDIDLHVKRTQARPITAGLVSVSQALWFFVILVLLSFALVCSLQKPLVIALSLPALLIAVVYPLTKRFFSLPQAVLGVAFGFGIPMAFAAIQQTVPLIAWLMLIANVFWALAYDTEYAMVDRDDDLKLGIRTSAITFGRFDVIAVMVCYGVFMMISLAVAVSALGYNRLICYAVGWILALLAVIYHYDLIKDRQRESCFAAFRHNNYVGAFLFFGLFFAYF